VGVQGGGEGGGEGVRGGVGVEGGGGRERGGARGGGGGGGVCGSGAGCGVWRGVSKGVGGVAVGWGGLFRKIELVLLVRFSDLVSLCVCVVR